MGVTVTGLESVIIGLDLSAEQLAVNLAKAVRVTSTKVKADARSRIAGHRHLPAYPYSITYDIRVYPDAIEGEIGPDKDLRQGPLGNIVEFGTSKNAPIPHLGPALDANADDFLRGVDIAVEQALR